MKQEFVLINIEKKHMANVTVHLSEEVFKKYLLMFLDCVLVLLIFHILQLLRLLEDLKKYHLLRVLRVLQKPHLLHVVHELQVLQKE